MCKNKQQVDYNHFLQHVKHLNGQKIAEDKLASNPVRDMGRCTLTYFCKDLAHCWNIFGFAVEFISLVF